MRSKSLAIIALFLFPCLSWSANPKPLPIDQAFQFSVKPTRADAVVAHWRIAKGYYLYKDRFHFNVKSPKNALIGTVFMPKGIEKTDDILGKHVVYANALKLSIPIVNNSKKPLQLLVHYQGCAEWGFCYPPTTKQVTIQNKPLLTAKDIRIENVTAPLTALQIGKAKPNTKVTTNKSPSTLSEQAQASFILQNKNFAVALLLFFGFGLLLAFTPCVLPMIPILSGIIVGHGKTLSTSKAFYLSLAYVLGMSITFALAGVIVGFIGSSIQAALQTPAVIVGFSIVFVVLALSLFGFYELQLPQRFQQKITQLSQKQRAGHYAGVALMGALSTLIVSPCVSAPLVGALAYIGNTGNAVFGGSALFAMGLGMGAPLLLIGTSFGKWLPKAGHWMNTVKIFFGVLLLGVAIWMLERIIAGPAALFLWAALAIISSIYMGAVTKIPETGWQKLWKGCGIILLTYGILLIIGAAMGNSDPFKPLAGLSGLMSHQSKPGTQKKISFKPVKSIADVERELNSARKLRKPVMLDFYADWCVACKEMERYTFTNFRVQQELSNFILLQANVTANDKQDRALQKHYGVIAPPTILFFDRDGKELKPMRVVGMMSAEAFAQHLTRM